MAERPASVTVLCIPDLVFEQIGPTLERWLSGMGLRLEPIKMPPSAFALPESAEVGHRAYFVWPAKRDT